MKKLAIIGSGISGLGVAHYLHDRYDMEIFEKNSRPGGHVNTRFVTEERNTFPVDTGFIVFNRITYPGLIRLFDELGVTPVKSDMSFSLHNRTDNLQFSAAGWNGLFGQRRNIVRPRHWSFLLSIARFNRNAPLHLKGESLRGSLNEYLDREGFDEYFRLNYILPLGSAIWSVSLEEILEFPARTFVRFFLNHGLLGMNTQHQWWTLKQGSVTYVNEILKRFTGRLHLDAEVRSVRRTEHGVELDVKGRKRKFDLAVLAVHSDQALKLLKQPTRLEKELLGAIPYTRNVAVLHNDTNLLPPLRNLWSSWNSRLERFMDSHKSATTYYMNRLQPLPSSRHYLVSINEFDRIEPGTVIERMEYEHPRLDHAALAAQKRLQELNRTGPLYFCGAYFRYGFHEDGLASALEVVGRLCR